MAGHRNKKGKKANKDTKGPKGKKAPVRRRPEQQWHQQEFKGASVSFSLADEVRWMATHRSAAVNTDRRSLRERIQFVSAGYLEGTIPVSTPVSIPVQEEKEPEKEIGKELDPHVALATTNIPLAPFLSTSSTTSTTSTPTSIPPTDHPTSNAISVPSAAMAQLAIDSPGVTPGASNESADQSSSEDEIIFRGRGHQGHSKSYSAPTQASSTENTAAQRPAADVDSDDDAVIQDAFEKRLNGQPKRMVGTTPNVSRSDTDTDWLSVEDRPHTHLSLAGRASGRDAAMEDYMQNIDNSENDISTFAPLFARRPMEVDNFDSDEFFIMPQPRLATFRRRSMDSDLLNQLRDPSTKQNQQLAEFTDEYIEDDESDEDDGPDEDDDQDNPELAAVDESDEAYALRLQKQFDYGAEADIFYGDDVYLPRVMRSNRNKVLPKSHGKGPVFPSASAMADAIEQDPYGGFDIMDTLRPSLRPKNKGRRSQMPPELSDSDLNAQMQATFENDRAKKRLKKAEREELRKQGLLGRKGKGPDLRVKYKDGVNMGEIIEVIREFLFSDKNTISLPPMDARSRSVIHQFVHKLGLTSRSRGEGADRFTVLSRSLRTLKIDDDEFDEIVGARRFRSRLHPPSTRSGPKIRPVVSYQDGDTVGEFAPELGPENRGRRLLEKMGWSQGTALGALDNKGILQPIAHTVKTTKAGLQ